MLVALDWIHHFLNQRGMRETSLPPYDINKTSMGSLHTAGEPEAGQGQFTKVTFPGLQDFEEEEGLF